MRQLLLILCISLLCTACGEKAPAPRPRPEVPIRPARDVPPIERKRPPRDARRPGPDVGVRPVDDTPAVEERAPAPVEPVRARTLYELAAPAALAAQLEAASAKPVAQPRKTDALWVGRVGEALAAAGINKPPRARVAQLPGGALDIVEVAGEDPTAAWTQIERWRGENPTALSERAALYTTPISRAGMVVEPVPLSAVTAYRSNFDGPRHLILAWVHRGLFVRVGGHDVDAAKALHAALERLQAYAPAGKTGSGPEPSEPGSSRGAGGAGTHRAFLGSWVATQDESTFHFDVTADGTWRMANPSEASQSARGSWHATAEGYRLHVLYIEGKPVEAAQQAEVEVQGATLIVRAKDQEPQRFSRRGASPAVEPPNRVAAAVGTWNFRAGDARYSVHIDRDGSWRTSSGTLEGVDGRSGTWTVKNGRYTLTLSHIDGKEATPSVALAVIRGGELHVVDKGGDDLVGVRAKPTDAFEESFGDTDDLSDAPFTGGGKDTARPDDVSKKGAAWLGVHAHHIDASTAEIFGAPQDGGVLLSHVELDSPAHRAGLRAMHVIVALDGNKVRDAGHVEDILKQKKPGERVRIHVTHTEPLTVQLASELSRSKDAPLKQHVRFGSGDALVDAEAARLLESGYRLSSIAGSNGRWMMMYTQAGAEKLEAFITPPSIEGGVERLKDLAPDGWMLGHVAFDGTMWVLAVEKGPGSAEQQVGWSRDRRGLTTQVAAQHKRGFYVTDLAYGAGSWVAVFTKRYYAPEQRIVSVATSAEAFAAVEAQIKSGWHIAEAAREGEEWFLAFEKRPKSIQVWGRTEEAALLERLPTLWEQGDYVIALCADGDGWFVVADRKR